MKQLTLVFAFNMLAIFLTACPSVSSETPNPTAPSSGTKRLDIEVLTTPIGDWTELDLVIERGDSLFISLNKVAHVSFDKGRTWRTINSDAVGGVLDFAWKDAKSAYALTGNHGLVGFDFNDDTVWYLDNEPSWDTWAVSPDGTLYAVKVEVDEGKLQIGDEVATVTLHKLQAFRSQGAESWESTVLPNLKFSARSFRPSIHFSSKGDVYLASHFGLQKQTVGSTDWQTLSVIPDVQGALSWSDVNIFVSKEESIFVHFNTVFVSRNQGASYEELSQYPEGTKFQDVYQSQDGALRFSSSPSFSTDQGQTWQSDLNLDKYAFDNTSATLNRLFFATNKYFLEFRFLGVLASENPSAQLEIFNPLPDNAFNTRHWGESSGILPTRDDGFLSLWKSGLVRFDTQRQVWLFEQGTLWSYFDRLSDGRFVAKTPEGLVYSTDEGRSWSEPIAINASGFVESSITPTKVMSQGQGQLIMSALYPRSPTDCKMLPLMKSRDNGQTWQAVTLDLRDNENNPTDLLAGSVQLSTIDQNGVLFGAYRYPVPNGFQCLYETLSTARSLDDGTTWKSNPSLQPFAVTKQNTLISFQGSNENEELFTFKQGASSWESLGKTFIGGQANPINLYIGQFLYIDPFSTENKLIVVHKGQAYKSKNPID